MYHRLALPHARLVFSTIHELGSLGRLHIYGNTCRVVADMVESGSDIVDLDWIVNMGMAGRQFGDQVSFCGKLRSGSSTVTRLARRGLTSYSGIAQ
jgi:uroporphyrinogen decarboxylase